MIWRLWPRAGDLSRFWLQHEDRLVNSDNRAYGTVSYPHSDHDFMYLSSRSATACSISFDATALPPSSARHGRPDQTSLNGVPCDNYICLRPGRSNCCPAFALVPGGTDIQILGPKTVPMPSQCCQQQRCANSGHRQQRRGCGDWGTLHPTGRPCERYTRYATLHRDDTA